MNADRIVMGFEDLKTKYLMKKIYASWNCEKIYVNTRTAEMIKYSNNSLLALQISAANELANICYSIGNIDVDDVFKGIHSDKRWNPITKNKRQNPEILQYLYPGCGFGGSCFPKDLQILSKIKKKFKIKSRLFDEVLIVNKNQPLEIIKILKNSIKKIDNKKIMILGLSFKPNTDDVRESISLVVINKLLSEKGVEIFAHDPVAMQKTKQIFNKKNNIYFINDWRKNISFVDIVILMTKWAEYKKLKSQKIIMKLKNKTFFDARKMFKKNNFPNINYLTVGKS